jgi:uncharacterized protein
MLSLHGQIRVRRGLIVAVLAALIGASVMGIGLRAAAQEATPSAGGSAITSTVTVSGNGSVTIPPDAATISVGVNVINANLSEAQAAATSSMSAVIEALKAAGIDEKDIQTTNYSVTVLQEYDTNGYPARVSGYQVNNQVNVLVRDLDQLGTVLDEAVKAGANSIYGVSFVVTDPSGAATQARTAAIADATKKAQEIAAATGMTLGRVVTVTEVSGPAPLPYAYGKDEAMDMAASVPIQTGGSTVMVDVQITFELVP